MKIIIVEDEIRIREGLGRLIQKMSSNYEIVGEADNGTSGLVMARDLMPDVIVTDIKMPEMDGLEMLKELYQTEDGSKAKAIVLSAYSEFEYARQAIHLGVKEYLLKPLVVDDISEALKRVEKEIEQEKEQKEEIIGNAEQLFSGILWGNIKINEQIKEAIVLHFDIPANTTFDGICCYLGTNYEKQKEAAIKELQQLFDRRKGQRYMILEEERSQMLVVLLYLNPDSKELRRWVQYWLLQDTGRKLRGPVGFVSGVKLEDLKDNIDTLLQYMDWNIALGDEVMISYPQITELQTNPCIYPLGIESQMKIEVCAGEKDKIQQCLNRFSQYFRSGGLYSPREIKECYVRFFWAFMNVGKELGILEYEKLEQQKLLERIMSAKTAEELREVGRFLESKLMDDSEATHLTIKRAQRLIQEFYQTGITLDEIAGKLHITPEYLGTKFHKEMGMTFGTYMKNIRITKAKELLIGTSLKLYEISEKVGYSDARYFSRVFRETTGQLPADYRKTHK